MNLTIRRVNSLPTITVSDCIYVVSERNEASSDLTKPNLYFVVTDSQNNIVKRSTNGADIEAVKTELAATIASAVSAIYAALEDKSDVGHTHTEEELEPIIRSVILPILSGYSEIDHTHNYLTMSEISELLGNKANVDHTHHYEDITGLLSVLNQKASVNHTHSPGDLGVVDYDARIAAIETEIYSVIHPELGNLASDISTETGQRTGEDANIRGEVAVHVGDLTATDQDLQAQIDGLSNELSGFGNALNGIGEGLGTHTHVIESIESQAIEGLLKYSDHQPEQAVAAVDYVAPDTHTVFSAPQTPSSNARLTPVTNNAIWNLDTTQILRVNLTEDLNNLTVTGLTIDKVGTHYQVMVLNNGGEISWGSNFMWPDESPAEASGAVGKFDSFTFIVETVDGLNAILCNIGSVKNIG